MADNLVKVIKRDEAHQTITLGGYGVVFGGDDLMGEHFSAKTDFWLDKLGPPLLLYQHGQDEKMQKAVLGHVGKVSPDEVGLWVESQIAISEEYLEYVNAMADMAEQGRLGLSSGSVGHLVERSGKLIKSWPIIEFSLTPTPAEPRTLGVRQVRMLVTDDPKIEQYLPEGDGEPPEQDMQPGAKPEPIQPKAKQVENKEPKMEFTQEQIQAMLQETVTKTLEGLPAFQKALHDEPDGTGTKQDETKSFANFLVSVQRHDVKRLMGVYKSALAETSGATGGYIVPPEYASEIMAIATEKSFIRQRAFVIPGVRESYSLPVLYNGGGAAGTPASLAGVVATWTAEGGAKTETEPTFDQVMLKPQELSGYTLASNKVIADSGAALETVLRRLFGEAIAWYEEYAFLQGDGVGKPLGVFNSPCLDTSNTIATDSTLVLADLAEMLGSMLPSAADGACWVMHPLALPQLVQLVAASSGNLIWVPNVTVPLASNLLLFGKPIFFSEKMPVIPAVQNAVGGVLYANFSYYAVADGVGGLAIDFSEHYKFTNNQGTWRFTENVDGQPWLKNTITLADGSTTVSPFVSTKGPA